MNIHESAENYLETILILHNRKGYVRSIDIATELSFSKPSVSVAMKNLRQKEYIVMDEEGYIRLTETGRAIAEKTYERHIVLSKLLVSLGVPEETASADACKIEHVISDATFDALKQHGKRYASISKEEKENEI